MGILCPTCRRALAYRQTSSEASGRRSDGITSTARPVVHSSTASAHEDFARREIAGPGPGSFQPPRSQRYRYAVREPDSLVLFLLDSPQHVTASWFCVVVQRRIHGSHVRRFAHVKGTKAPEGATTGAGTGAVVGGTLGWLTGVGALAIPGLGPFIAAGPIMAALAGAGVGGAVGGVTGALIGMGIPEYEAKRYEGRVTKGGILLSVHSDNSAWTKRAKDILVHTGADDVSSTGETKGDMQNSDRPMPKAGVV